MLVEKNSQQRGVKISRRCHKGNKNFATFQQNHGWPDEPNYGQINEAFSRQGCMKESWLVLATNSSNNSSDSPNSQVSHISISTDFPDLSYECNSHLVSSSASPQRARLDNPDSFPSDSRTPENWIIRLKMEQQSNEIRLIRLNIR